MSEQMTRDPWWCDTCQGWRHTAPCGRDECPALIAITRAVLENPVYPTAIHAENLAQQSAWHADWPGETAIVRSVQDVLDLSASRC